MFKFGQLILFLSDAEHFAALKHALAYAGCEYKAGGAMAKVCRQQCPKGGRACPGLDEQK
jgi:hypothetical protein